MTQFIDRRPNGKNKSAVNRQRFIRRFKNQIKKAVSSAIANRHVTDIENGEKITIPAKNIREPKIYYGPGGLNEGVFPGNQDFVTGDRLKRPLTEESGQGSDASGGANEGLDDFVFEISKEEFMELFFEDLELPDLVKKQIKQTATEKSIRAGYTTSGSPTNLNIKRSFKSALGRRIALTAPYKKQLQEAEARLALLMQQPDQHRTEINEVKAQIARLQHKIRTVPFIESFDLRYNYRAKQPNPSTQAVMFCLMDVSGSMDEIKKDIAKRFFIILYLFLSRTYQKINIIFIRHHTTAKEVEEKEFFYSRETGGTVVSSALELLHKIIVERYASADWNIYVAQASDGDNWNADSPHCQEVLLKEILPAVQYFAYVEIKSRQHQSLWDAYLDIKAKFPKKFAMKSIHDYAEIYPVFHDLFKRRAI